ncbi:MAG: branched-chain amino acid transaminase [Microcystis sp. M113S1]|jgi:branched-chain amino acid aminotransferase|uniref:branched-chain amino acid transaminase n=1 Tax=Microcystis sp. M113S1 TaxID=2771104 RepID=UPI002590E12E|nr:branched-chain amino acid transaminase [Microcystis sp. M113S1]MCA2939795.1 branched-chain amino acid transaminase [Microcystis sp. M113S1]NCR34772.1 branched-chain amino acid transaminase [Microcystis aeruginosa S11-05]NCR48247.1 branched-chain amino acid transaminase [Microcystis aeruginosa S11-01]
MSITAEITFLPLAYFENKFIPFSEAKLSIATHALHYGTAAFGGLRGTPDPSNPGQILLFRLDRHSQRLSQSAKFLNYEIPADKIYQIIIDFVKKNQCHRPFYIRPLVYSSGLGIAPRLHGIEKDFLVYGLEMDDYLAADGVNCRISSWYRQEDRSFPLRGKISAAYITSALAKTEAVESGFDEAILMNSQGKVCEATGMNIFIIRNGQLITPSFDQDILEGITRDSVLTIARDLGIPVIERPIDKTELFIADEVFLSGTAAKITPIKRIETFSLPAAKPITYQLKEKLSSIVLNQEPKYQDWITKVPL